MKHAPVELSLFRVADTAKMRTLIDALPNGDPDLDPKQYINDDAIVTENFIECNGLSGAGRP